MKIDMKGRRAENDTKYTYLLPSSAYLLVVTQKANLLCVIYVAII